MAVVRLLNNKEFLCAPGSTILDSARLHDAVLEYSCKTGRCGVCKAIAVGETAVVKYDELVLSTSEAEQGYILTCCRTALSDVELGVEDLSQFAGLKVKTLPCRVDSLRYIAGDVLEVILRLPPNTSFEYLPGQYIDVISKEGIRRSYSIANAPRDDGKIELQIRRVPQGVMSKYWFEDVQVNDLLRFEGPQGTFALRGKDVKNIVFLATGTGIAPVKAMFESISKAVEKFAHINIWIYWGGRFSSDIYWEPSLPNVLLSFVPVLSRVSEGWVGRSGYVQDALVADGVELADSVVYACGSKEMIGSAKARLIALGLPSGNFYSDAFVSSN